MSEPYRSELLDALNLALVTIGRGTNVPASERDHSCVAKVHNSRMPGSVKECAAESAANDCDHSCVAKAQCKWVDDSGRKCAAEISCNMLSAHLRGVHNKKVEEDGKVSCRWAACLKRSSHKNFIRHVRECHLGHHREPADEI
ncbi:hypothetical protein JVU11DRAFT_291 [Chiua virens]|nr:hypothetical protein JVU11DRAFT_291 [Chiua virens]